MRGIDGLRRFMNKLSTHKSCEYSQSVHENEGITTHNMRGLQLLYYEAANIVLYYKEQAASEVQHPGIG